MPSLPRPLQFEETGRMLRESTGESLGTITRDPRGFAVAENFNTPGHGLDDLGRVVQSPIKVIPQK